MGYASREPISDLIQPGRTPSRYGFRPAEGGPLSLLCADLTLPPEPSPRERNDVMSNDPL